MGFSALKAGLALAAFATLALADEDFVPYRPDVTESAAASAAATATPVLAGPLLKGNISSEQFYQLPFKKRVFYYNWWNELMYLAVVVGFVALHLGGDYWNRHKAKKFVTSQLETLRSQFYQVGFDASVNLVEPSKVPLSKILKRLGPIDYVFYATGRLNVTMLHGKLTLLTRHNIIMLFFDFVLSSIFGYELPKDLAEFIVKPTENYDSFVFAIVHKDNMKRVREDNYDVSLTKTSDHPKLPISMSVMSEASEITETFLTPELLTAIKDAENVLEYFILSDLFTVRPRTVEEFVPKKRGIISFKIAKTPQDEAATANLLTAFLNTIDLAVAKAHWRPEVLRKLKATRDEEIRKIKKIADEEKAEELANQRAKEKKEQKKGIAKLSAEEQKKAQLKEREKEMRRLRGKQTRKA